MAHRCSTRLCILGAVELLQQCMRRYAEPAVVGADHVLWQGEQEAEAGICGPSQGPQMTLRGSFVQSYW